jgi:hypothetical protein
VSSQRGEMAQHRTERRLRSGISSLASLGGAIGATLALPSASPWVAWVSTIGQVLPGPVLVGFLLAASSSSPRDLSSGQP